MRIFTTSAIRSNTQILDAEKVILSVCVPADPGLKNYVQFNIRVAAGAFGNASVLHHCKTVLFPSVLIQLDEKYQKSGKAFFKTGSLQQNIYIEKFYAKCRMTKKPGFRIYKLSEESIQAGYNDKMIAFSRKVENFTVNENANEILLFPDTATGTFIYDCQQGFTAEVMLAYDTVNYKQTTGFHFKTQAEIAVLFQSEFSSTKKYESVIA